MSHTAYDATINYLLLTMKAFLRQLPLSRDRPGEGVLFVLLALLFTVGIPLGDPAWLHVALSLVFSRAVSYIACETVPALQADIEHVVPLPDPVVPDPEGVSDPEGVEEKPPYRHAPEHDPDVLLSPYIDEIARDIGLEAAIVALVTYDPPPDSRRALDQAQQQMPPWVMRDIYLRAGRNTRLQRPREEAEAAYQVLHEAVGHYVEKLNEKDDLFDGVLFHRPLLSQMQAALIAARLVFERLDMLDLDNREQIAKGLRTMVRFWELALEAAEEAKQERLSKLGAPFLPVRASEGLLGSAAGFVTAQASGPPRATPSNVTPSSHEQQEDHA